MGFTDSCRNIRLEVSDNDLTLKAECRKSDGSYRWSNLDLEDCVNFNMNGNLEASTGGHSRNWLLVDNRDLVRGVRLEGSSTLRAECAIKKGAFFWERLEWIESRLNLNDYVRNINGHLEFLHPKSESMFPEWFHTAVDIADKIANAPGDVDEAYEQAQEEFMQSIGEAHVEGIERKWLEGALPQKDGRIYRRGD